MIPFSQFQVSLENYINGFVSSDGLTLSNVVVLLEVGFFDKFPLTGVNVLLNGLSVAKLLHVLLSGCEKGIATLLECHVHLIEDFRAAVSFGKDRCSSHVFKLVFEFFGEGVRFTKVELLNLLVASVDRQL